jgi:hypothetical protein
MGKKSGPETINNNERRLKLNTREGMIEEAKYLQGIERAMDHSNVKVYKHIKASIDSLRKRLGKNFPEIEDKDTDGLDLWME